MNPIRTLLVDDEYLALQLLESYAAQVPGMEIVGKACLPLQALDIIREQTVDLLFLDIQMPVLSGTHLVKVLPQPAPLVVFTTAYSDYAIEAFDLNVVDYLLKPFPIERFVQAVQKARDILQRAPGNPLQPPDPSPGSRVLPEYITVKADGKIVRIPVANILFVEGLKEYVRFICIHNQKYIVLDSLKNLEIMLPAPAFIRVHKSFLVAKDKVSTLDGNMLEIGPHKIPISRTKREEVLKEIFGV